MPAGSPSGVVTFNAALIALACREPASEAMMGAFTVEVRPSPCGVLS